MKKLILTLSLALALTMTASATGNEVSRAKTLVAYFSFPIDSGKEAQTFLKSTRATTIPATTKKSSTQHKASSGKM